MEFSEALVVSESGNKDNVNCTFYNVKNGALLGSFSGGKSVRNGLVFVGEDYLISAIKDKPVLKVWTLSKKPQDTKMTSPGIVSCLAVTNCGMYCVAGIEKSIHVWEISSGCLITVIQYHSQAVSCLRFSSDGSHFISGGKDGMVLVWLLSEAVVSNDSCDNIKPRFTWMDHAAEVTDIFVGSNGFYARVATASKDMTCRIYELETGFLLTTVRVDYSITAVTMDETEYFLILGSLEGDIFRINLFSVKEAEVHYSKEDSKCSFPGHTKAITCLSISSSGKYLVSGSEDQECRIWEMTNFTIVRKLQCNGPVTNAVVIPMPPGMVLEKWPPRFNLNTFQRTYEQDSDTENVFVRIQDRKLSLFHLGSPDEYFDSRILNSSAEYRLSLCRGNVTIEDMKNTNAQMYSHALGDMTSLKDLQDSDDDDDDDEDLDSD